MATQQCPLGACFALGLHVKTQFMHGESEWLQAWLFALPVRLVRVVWASVLDQNNSPAAMAARSG